MQSNFTCLNEHELERLASGDFTPQQLEELERHVDQCSNCLELLQQHSQSPWLDNSVAARLLAPDESTSSRFQENATSTSASVDSILKMLGPTDDPHRMGRIDGHEIVGIIGRGGFGVVFKAFDPALQRFVAIKMLLPHLAESAAARKRFAREAKAAAAVVDDHVLPIYSVAQWRGSPYIVTQYCRGETLQRRIENTGPMEIKEILRISMQIAKGLAAAHAQGLVHRDVKPANILLDQGIERVQLTDFGLARAMDDASMTHTGVLAGTPQYMSPEQSRGESLDGRSDLFALGSVMYAMCTGRPPFRGSQPLAVLSKIANDPHQPACQINPDIPRPLSQLIGRLLEKHPAHRIQSATELGDWLEHYLAHLQQPDAQSRPRLPMSKRRWRTIQTSTFVAASVLVAIVCFLFGANRKGKTPTINAAIGNHPAVAASPLDGLPPGERMIVIAGSSGQNETISSNAMRFAKWFEGHQALSELEQDLHEVQTQVIRLHHEFDQTDRNWQQQTETGGWSVDGSESHPLTGEIQNLKTEIESYESRFRSW